MSERQDWQTLYAAAMLENDTTQLRKRIEKADEAIRVRLRQLPGTSSPRSEEAELRYALDYLRRLNAP
jgi:hypothetical protein